MNPRNLTYDISRCYIFDLKGTIPDSLYHTLIGWNRSRELERLVSSSSLWDPEYHGSHELAVLMQVEAFFKKNRSFSDEERCKAAARLSFERGERICRIANRRLDHYYLYPDRLCPQIRKWVTRMESDIFDLLGDFSLFLEQIPRRSRVTAGATATKSRRKSKPHLRVSKRPYANPRAEPYLDALSQHFGYGSIKVRGTRANRVEFVPKNWKTYRSIACEPEGNVFLQLAADSYIKDRLKRWNINLRSQSRNQDLAQVGSIDGSLATIDLSMASDTLAYNTVAWLFPQSWFGFLDATRSSESRGEAQVLYAKFSSMGNGYTFVLETLVFAAACRAVGSKVACVYGDDIVIEAELAEDLMRLLHFFGFFVNTEKSYVTGPFRESCGANWYQGSDITPVYVRDIDRRKAMMCHLVNSLAAVAKPEGHLAARLRNLISELHLPFAPFTESTISGVWVDETTTREKKLIRTRKNRKWIPAFRSYVPVAYKESCRDTRALFLWYLDTLERNLPPSMPVGFYQSDWYRNRYRLKIEPAKRVLRTRYTTSSHRFRRKWVRWNPPAVSAPDHLFWWSEYITRRKAG